MALWRLVDTAGRQLQLRKRAKTRMSTKAVRHEFLRLTSPLNTLLLI